MGEVQLELLDVKALSVLILLKLVFLYASVTGSIELEVQVRQVAREEAGGGAWGLRFLRSLGVYLRAGERLTPSPVSYMGRAANVLTRLLVCLICTLTEFKIATVRLAHTLLLPRNHKKSQKTCRGSDFED